MKLQSRNPKFELRHARLDDAGKYLECFQGKNLSVFLFKFPRNLIEAKKDLMKKISDYKKKNPFGEIFAIIVDRNFAGYVELHHLNLEHQEHKCEIGYAVHPKFRGKGIATKAVKILTKYAFKKYKLKRISTTGRVKNKGSARVLEKAGYKLEGILKKNKFVDGEYYDDFIYARVR